MSASYIFFALFTLFLFFCFLCFLAYSVSPFFPVSCLISLRLSMPVFRSNNIIIHLTCSGCCVNPMTGVCVYFLAWQYLDSVCNVCSGNPHLWPFPLTFLSRFSECSGFLCHYVEQVFKAGSIDIAARGSVPPSFSHMLFCNLEILSGMVIDASLAEVATLLDAVPTLNTCLPFCTSPDQGKLYKSFSHVLLHWLPLITTNPLYHINRRVSYIDSKESGQFLFSSLTLGYRPRK